MKRYGRSRLPLDFEVHLQTASNVGIAHEKATQRSSILQVCQRLEDLGVSEAQEGVQAHQVEQRHGHASAHPGAKGLLVTHFLHHYEDRNKLTYYRRCLEKEQESAGAFQVMIVTHLIVGRVFRLFFVLCQRSLCL